MYHKNLFIQQTCKIYIAFMETDLLSHYKKLIYDSHK